jgi:hypothetical protein
MKLQPEQSLDRLTQALKDLRSPHKDRAETLQQLQGIVTHCELELGNLNYDIRQNPERARLYRELTFTVEMAKAELPRS